MVHFREQDQEFISAMPAHGIGLAYTSPQALRDGAQDLIPRTVPKRIVDVLESIAIEKEHRNATAVAARQRNRARQAIIQQQSIGQVRQSVMLGEVEHL